MKPLFPLVLAVVVSEVLSRSAGPPVSSFRDRICDQMLPNHGGTSARPGNGGYSITTNIPRSVSSGYSFTAGQTYTGSSQIIYLTTTVSCVSTIVYSDLERYEYFPWISGNCPRPRPEQHATGSIHPTKLKPADTGLWRRGSSNCSHCGTLQQCPYPILKHDVFVDGTIWLWWTGWFQVRTLL